MICDKCNGTGNILEDNNIDIYDKCNKCYGKKDLDWIENIVGVDEYWRWNQVLIYGSNPGYWKNNKIINNLDF